MIFLTITPVWQSARNKWRYDFKPTKEVPVYHTDPYRLTSSPTISPRRHARVGYSGPSPGEDQL